MCNANFSHTVVGYCAISETNVKMYVGMDEGSNFFYDLTLFLLGDFQQSGIPQECNCRYVEELTTRNYCL